MIVVPHEHIHGKQQLRITNNRKPHGHMWTSRTLVLLGILSNPYPGDQSGSMVLVYVFAEGYPQSPRVSVLTCVFDTRSLAVRAPIGQCYCWVYISSASLHLITISSSSCPHITPPHHNTTPHNIFLHQLSMSFTTCYIYIVKHCNIIYIYYRASWILMLTTALLQPRHFWLVCVLQTFLPHQVVTGIPSLASDDNTPSSVLRLLASDYDTLSSVPTHLKV